MTEGSTQVEIRPMDVDDLPGLVTSAERAFRDLHQRLGTPSPASAPTPRAIDVGEAIVRHLLDVDAAGAWTAVLGDTVVGVALAGLRERVWYLAQLHVDPARQGQGVGRRLLDAA